MTQIVKDCTPLPNEHIRDWVRRFKEVYGIPPKDQHLAHYKWHSVSVSEIANGKNSSLLIQNAIMLMNEMFEDERDFYWAGRLQFWFNTVADAVTFKLQLSSV